jgi:hypothetical protein
MMSIDDVVITVERSSFQRVKAEGAPASTSDEDLLLIHAGHLEALVRACKQGGHLPYEDEGWVLGCV